MVIIKGCKINSIYFDYSEGQGGSCDPLASFPFGYKSHCQQKYMYRKLVALNNSGAPVPDSFRLPSCCACKVVLSSENIAGRSRPRVNETANLEPLPLTIDSTTVRSTQKPKNEPRRLNSEN